MTRIQLPSAAIEKHQKTFSHYVDDVFYAAACGLRFHKRGDWSWHELKADELSIWKGYFQCLLKFGEENGDLTISPPSVLDKAIKADASYFKANGLVFKEGLGKYIHDFLKAYLDYGFLRNGRIPSLRVERRDSNNALCLQFQDNPTGWCTKSLFEALDIKVCPYCNNVTLPFRVVEKDSGGRQVLPDMDHAFNKDLYPYLALSIYNLIPACDVCNRRIKEQRTLDYIKHAHPYVDDVHVHVAFCVPEDYIENVALHRTVDWPQVRIVTRSEDSDPRAMNLMRFFDIPGLCKGEKQVMQAGRVVKEVSEGSAYSDCRVRIAGLNMQQRKHFECCRFGCELRKEAINHYENAKLTLDVYEQCKRVMELGGR